MFWGTTGLGRVYNELKEWEHAGLIGPFENNTMQDVVFADLLKAIREHLAEGKQ